MNAISSLYETASPLQAVAPVAGRQAQAGRPEDGQGRFQASEVHSHGELSSACPNCGHTLNLVA